jgi:long-chain acyl-CoA synthetase
MLVLLLLGFLLFSFISFVCFVFFVLGVYRHISYLPLAHIYERMNVLVMLHFGVGIGFYQGDVLKLMEDIEVLKPTIFCSVPRLYNRIYDKITSAVKSSGRLRQRLYNVAYNAKKDALEKGKTPSPIWDRLVFNKIKGVLGGRVRCLCSGASPISPDVLDFLRICFGGFVSEGYGMTETSCLVAGSEEDDKTSGHVGPPTPACEVKLVDVPEMEYTSEDKPYPRGEICVRGPTIFKGYYKDEIQTSQFFLPSFDFLLQLFFLPIVDDFPCGGKVIKT